MRKIRPGDKIVSDYSPLEYIVEKVVECDCIQTQEWISDIGCIDNVDMTSIPHLHLMLMGGGCINGVQQVDDRWLRSCTIYLEEYSTVPRYDGDRAWFKPYAPDAPVVGLLDLYYIVEYGAVSVQCELF